MTVAFVDLSTVAGTTGSNTLTLPTWTVDTTGFHDRIFIAVNVDTATDTIDTPAGYQLLLGPTSAGSGVAPKLYVFMKTAVSADSGASVTITRTGTGAWSGMARVYSGVGGVDTAAIAGNGATAAVNMPLPSTSPKHSGEMEIGFWSWIATSSSAAFTTPSGWGNFNGRSPLQPPYVSIDGCDSTNTGTTEVSGDTSASDGSASYSVGARIALAPTGVPAIEAYGVDVSSGGTIDDTSQTRSVTLTGVNIGDIIVVVSASPLADNVTFTLTGVSTSGTNEQILHLSGGFGGGFGHATANTVTVTAATNGRRSILMVAAISNIAYAAGNSTLFQNGVGPTDIDVGGTNGTTYVHPGAGGVEVVAWGLYGGDTSGGDPAPTTSFTDTNGNYTTVSGVLAGTSFATQSREVAEIAFAVVPAAGTTDHVGHRTDALTGTGFMVAFVAPPPPPARKPVIVTQAVRRAARG